MNTYAAQRGHVAAPLRIDPDAWADVPGYRRGARLGAGASGVVYAATALGADRPAALKVARTRADEPGLAAAFRLGLAVRHPGLIAARHLTRDVAGRLVLVSDLADGPTLETWIPPSAAVADRVALDLARAVAALHAHRRVHGDLSPGNVVLGGSPARPKLLDLGADALTGAVPATVGFAAPERLRGGAPDPASDRYALGCLVHALCVRRPLFAGVPADRLVDAHLTGTPDLDLPSRPDLAAVLRRLLARAPIDRFASTDDAVEALERALGGAPPEPPSHRLQGACDIVGADATRVARAAVRDGRGVLVEWIGPGRVCRSSAAMRAAAESVLAGAAALLVDSEAGAPTLHALGRALGLSDGDDSALAGAVLEALVAAAAPRPLVVLVDLSTEDAGRRARTLEVLAAAARVAPVIGLVTGSADARPTPGARTFAVPPLDGAARHAALSERLDAPAEVIDAVGQLLAESGVERMGHLLASLSALADAQLLVRRGGRWTADRDRLLRDGLTVITRAADPTGTLLTSLTRPARRRLAVLGALHGRAPAAVLSEVDVDLGIRDPLVARGLVRVDREETEHLLAAALGAAALSGLPPADRRALHAALARTLSDDATEQTWHRAHAGLPVAAESVTAAARALSGAGLSDRALTLLSAADGQLDRSIAARLRAEAHLARGEPDLAHAALEACLDEGDDPTVVEALGEALVRAGEHAAALRHFERHPPATPGARLLRAQAQLWTGDRERALATARILADEGQPSALQVAALHLWATATWQQGDLSAARALVERGLGHPEATAPAVRADLLRSLGAIAAYGGDATSAEAALVEAVETNRRLGRVPELAKSLNNLTMARHALGDWAGARAACEEFRLVCARTGDPVELANATNNLGFIVLRLGEPETAAGHFRATLRLAEEARYTRIVPVALGNLGEAQMRAGDLTEARATLIDALGRLEALGAHHDRLEVERRLAERALLAGDLDEAEQRARRVREDPRRDEVPLEVGLARRIEALVLGARGRTGDALRAAEAAQVLLDRHGGPYEQALGRLAVGAACLAVDRLDDAAAAADHALQVLTRLGARLDVDDARRLSAAVRQARGQLARRASRGDLLVDLGLAFGRTLELDTLAPLVLDRLTEHFNAERGVVALFGPDGGVERAVVEGLSWAGPGHPLPISASLLDQLRTGRRPVLVRDTQVDTTFAARRSVLMLGLRALVGVPILADDRVLGAIYLDSRRPVEVLEDELELLVSLSRFVGMAIDNARLYAEQQYRARLLATMVHDFRTPLTAISANASVLGLDLPPDEVAEIAVEIDASAGRMRSMIDHTLELSRIDEGVAHEAPEPTDLRALVTEHVRGLDVVARLRELSFVIAADDDPPLASSVPDQVRIVLDNLLFNALKHAPGHTEVRVSVRVRADAGPASAFERVRSAAAAQFRRVVPLRPRADAAFVEVEVANQGRPIPAAQLDVLFDPYARGAKSAGGHKSTGLGLSIVDELVRHLGGLVWAASDEAGTRFTFTLPTAVEPPAVD
ncbi:MAG: GAF domain-containing protein [Myxococcales bacterium]|nr:GAF domain-containing protein [Myxococcales bacterium]